jgi:hypothetical protein
LGHKAGWHDGVGAARTAPSETLAEDMAMNRFEGGGEAVVEYLDSNLRIVKPGAYVRCAVTGERIPLDQLKYWSVEHQEAYASPEAVLQRLKAKPARG